MKMSFIQKNNSEKGYTLLFAVIVSVLVLSIAAFILSVSRKEAILASSARDSIYAFYAADSGLECAVENLSALATSSGSISFNCMDKSINAIQNPIGGILSDPNTIAAGTSTFSMSNGAGASSQSGVSSCVSTTVSYVSIPPRLPGNSSGVATSTLITVTVRGYNIGWSGTDCSVPGPRKVERALQYTQQQ